MHFFFGWLSNGNSQRRIDFVGLVFMVPIGAHPVSAIMKITTTCCSLNAPLRKHYGGMFVTDATFQEWQKGLDEWIRLATVSWHGKSFVNFSRKLGFTATVYCIWQEWNARIFADVSKASNLVFDQIECFIRDKLVLMRNVQQTDENIKIQRLWRVNNMYS